MLILSVYVTTKNSVSSEKVKITYYRKIIQRLSKTVLTKLLFTKERYRSFRFNNI